MFAKQSEFSSKSSLLKDIIYENASSSDEQFPHLEEILNYYDKAFSHSEARNAGKIIPTSGVCKSYDEALNDIRSNEKDLNDYLNKQKKSLKISDLKYVHVQKSRYVIEIPESACRNLDEDFELMSSRKGFKR